MKQYSFVFAATSILAACGATDDKAAKVTTPHHDVPNTVEPDACSRVSGYQGDDLCLEPPAPGEGIQLHAGPKDYDDADALAPWIIAAGDENVKCFNAKIPESGFYYLRQENRMRSGSHHMLVNLVPDKGQAEGPTTNCDFTGGITGMLQGSQTPSSNFPGKDLGPEDDGIARYLPAGNIAQFQLHYVNLGTEPNLREAWVNLYKVDESEVKQHIQTVFMVGDVAVNIPPQTRETTTLTFQPDLPGETRIFQLAAHSHAHSESFTVWRLRGDEKEMVYQSFNWSEPKVMTYNSVVQNPEPDAVAKSDGGTTGILTLMPGDKLMWSCDVNNTLDTAIHFANEAHTAEMCLLGGSYISDTPALLAGLCASGQCNQGFPAGFAQNIDGR